MTSASQKGESKKQPGKKTWSQPALNRYGLVRELTAGGSGAMQEMGGGIGMGMGMGMGMGNRFP